MKYKISIKPSAKKELEKSPSDIRKRIYLKIESLSENPRPVGTRKIKNQKPNCYRVRVGDSRILYKVDDKKKTVIIYRIGQRDKVYLN